MRSITIKNVTKSYGKEKVIENLSLTIPSGKFFALLGPSGSGKTTLLRMIAGFEEVDAGTIYLGDQDITHAPINERWVNTVFQNYALFPHMNVFDNVAYSLHIRHIEKSIVQEKVMRALRRVHMEHHAYKSIDQLSGGQQQRIALARATINNPNVLLLDEPLAALDLKLREKMLLELIDLQDELGTTFIYVTHDQFEALTVADYMAIMNTEGEVEQVGTPKEIYEFPTSTFVAKFVGSTNILRGTLRVSEGESKIVFEKLGEFSIGLPKNAAWCVDGASAFMSIRPEKIEISKQPLQGFANEWYGQVESIVYHGRSTQYNVRLSNDQLISVFEQNEEHFPQEVIDYDDKVYLYWQKNSVVLLEK